MSLMVIFNMIHCPVYQHLMKLKFYDSLYQLLDGYGIPYKVYNFKSWNEINDTDIPNRIRRLITFSPMFILVNEDLWNINNHPPSDKIFISIKPIVRNDPYKHIHIFNATIEDGRTIPAKSVQRIDIDNMTKFIEKHGDYVEIKDPGIL